MNDKYHFIDIKPLSVNKLYTGKRYKTDDYRNYSNSLRWLLPKNIQIYPKMTISLIFGFENTSSDTDNPTKGFLDIISKFYGFNDKNVYKLIIEKQITKHPFIKFNIEKYIEN